ncbi:MAG: toprim domain-containing protein [Desulfocapsaceae bacterium]|nr:toprim domain-containing protein [Desulfocapsaceae bacterium]
MIDHIETFRQVIEAAGLQLPAEIIGDGKLHRFSASGKKDDTAGFYVLHLDGIPAGSFGSWRGEINTQSWRADVGRQLTGAEEQAHRQRIEAMRRARAEEEKRLQEESRKKASRIWKEAKPCTDHPYLSKKGVQAHGVRLYKGSLVIPLRISNDLHSLQFIDQTDSKWFLTGGRVSGCYLAIGNMPGANAFVICEGYATGASIHEATGFPVAVAFSAGNILTVARYMRGKLPDMKIIIAGDHDKSGTGQKSATEAAGTIKGFVAIPPATGQDWNDYHQQEGLAAVKACIEAAALSGQQEPALTPDSDEWEADIQEWPVMDQKAYRGIAGDFVALASENSEADPAAILITFLARFAVEVGSGPTLFVGDGKHHARFAAVIVGASSKARKGTSSKPVNRLYSKIERQARYSPGPFSSGEGIIHAVRDPVKKWDEKNQCDIIADPGVKDKRFFILDEEFGGAMSQTKREGNTLSTVIRCAWDSGNLDPLTKTSKTTATGAHIGWISHITISELHAKLSETEALNGFGNRIL